MIGISKRADRQGVFACGQCYLLVNFIQIPMNHDDTAIPPPSHTSLIQCSSCHLTCEFLGDSQMASDDITETSMIKIDQTCAYCTKCLQTRIQQEMQQVRSLQQRYIYHKEFESSFEQRQLTRHRLQSEASSPHLEQLEIAQLEKEEDTLTRDIGRLKEESNQLKEKIYALELEEDRFWEGINKIERRTNKVEEKSLNTKFDKNQEKDTLEEMHRFSVIHMFMDIRVDDSLALIQGMAMGRRGESAEVAWDEVAVGLGHLLIGLNLLVVKYSYEYRKISDLKLKGAQSEIWLRSKPKPYSVICTKQSQKLFGELLEAILYETHFLSDHILEAESIEYSEQFKLPFVINHNDCKVMDLFVDPLKIDERIRWNSWTKAMRYFLIDFKHILDVYAISDKYL